MKLRDAERLHTSERHLRSATHIKLKLENGEEVEFSIEREVRIPRSEKLLLEAARTAPSRFAFWAYQAERALHELRKSERECARVEGYNYHVYRKVRSEEGETPTEPMIRADIDQDSRVKSVRIALSARKREYGVLRAMRDAMEHRSWTLRALLQRREA